MVVLSSREHTRTDEVIKETFKLGSTASIVEIIEGLMVMFPKNYRHNIVEVDGF